MQKSKNLNKSYYANLHCPCSVIFFPLNIEQRRRGMQDDVGKSEQGDCEIVQSCA